MSGFEIHKLLVNNRFILVGVALFIAYVIFAIGQLNHFINTILQGTYYLYYQIIFLPLMYLAFQYYLKQHTVVPKKSYKIIIFGVIAGYISSLIATVLKLIFIPYGWERFLNSSKTFGDLLIRLFAPILHLGWLFGSLMGTIIVLMIKWTEKRRTL